MKTDMESSIAIEDRAAAWLTQRDSGEWTDADRHALEKWLGASIAHEVAFIRLEAAWSAADRLQAFGPGVTPGDVPSANTWHLPPTSHVSPRATKHSRRTFLTVAAGIALAIGAASTWYLQMRGPVYRTAVGGLASVPMQDGSRVTLNTDSEIRLAVNQRERAIELDRGEAFFEVAPDPHRPFVVKAGYQRITAVGTKFSVRRSGRNMVQIVVTEGKVRVDGNSSSEPVLLGAGGVARSSTDGLLVQPGGPSKADEYLSWRTGFLVFREVSLAEAVAEFNRYNERKLLVRDPAIVSIPVSGRFRTTNFEAFVRLVQNGFAVRAESSPEGIVLTHRKLQTPAE